MSREPTQEQNACIQAHMQKQSMIKINACAGSGKEQPMDTIVQTPQGPRMFGSLREGDSVFGANGKATKVVAIYPQGIKPVYELTFRDGSKTRCGLEHNWLVKNYKKYRVMTLREILDHGVLKNSGEMKFQIPLTSPVEYEAVNPLPIPAYTLGILLGDGYLIGSTPAVSVAERDKDILVKLKSENPSAHFNTRYTSPNCTQSTITEGRGGNTKGANEFFSRIKQLGLNVGSREKFIPRQYLQASVANRVELLKGLMDSDGSTSNGRTSFSTTSSQLSKDIKELVQSLGGIAICAEVRRDSEFHVNVKVSFNPFHTSFKKDRWRLSSKNPASRYLKSVSLVGEVPQMCITVEAEDHLYLTDEFIVTHNTTTLVLMAEAEAEPSLYLAFNKVTAEDGSKKFPSYVTCRTTHSIAYRAMGHSISHKLKRPNGKYQNVAYTGTEIARYYNVESYEASNGGKVSANHFGLLARQTVALFEQSDASEITFDHVPKKDLKEKLHDNGSNIAHCVAIVSGIAKRLWEDRINPDTVVMPTHDTYLKMFQLSKPILKGYEVIYVDEFQDTTPCVLDIILNQKATSRIVMVGDARQAIYGWRGAINAMERVEAPTYNLTKSFRYGQAIADVATAVLERDMIIKGLESIESQAAREDIVDRDKTHTRLFRTNAALLEAAVPEILAGKKLALEIDVGDFIKLLSSAFALYRGAMKDVKHDKVVPYIDWEELKVDGTSNDQDLKRIVKIVESGRALLWIDILENFDNAVRPSVVFTTAHKSKGREWYQVIVEDDFKNGMDEDGEWAGLPTEEQNLLYVACTRAIDKLEYNEAVSNYLLFEGKKQEQSYEVRKLFSDLKREGSANGFGPLKGEFARYAQDTEDGNFYD